VVRTVQRRGTCRRRLLQEVSSARFEDKKKALEFARQYHVPFDIVLDDGQMGKDYGAIGLPVHVFIDRHGKISTYRLGEMTPGEIEAAIKKIL